jgi:hypothetical protein
MNKTIEGTYGSHETPCNIFVHETRKGAWYCVEGSEGVNLTTPKALQDGVNVEELEDFDFFTWSGPIESEEELALAVLS